MNNNYIILTGKVFNGFGTGKLIGCPTINVHFELDSPIIIPGVYLGYISNGPSFRPSLLYVNEFNGHYTRINAHIIDKFDIITDSEATIKIMSKLRNKNNFNNDELRYITQLDINAARKYFNYS